MSSTTITEAVHEIFERHAPVEHEGAQWVGLEGEVAGVQLQVCAARMDEDRYMLFMGTYAGRVSFHCGPSVAWIHDGHSGQTEPVIEPDAFVSENLDRALSMPEPVRMSDEDSLAMISEFL